MTPYAVEYSKIDIEAPQEESRVEVPIVQDVRPLVPTGLYCKCERKQY